MKIKFSNGKELTPILVTGAHNYVQGLNRDTLTFVFPASESMEALDEAFSEIACESITVLDDSGNGGIYKFYTIRVKMEKTLVEVRPATTESEAVTEERISVSMAQRTYVETQLSALSILLTGEE